ncbi:MAG: ABC transporter permease [Dehalococcoidia bacterium]|nr:ABC transporter permease [Dehalococcoidia bacterium]
MLLRIARETFLRRKKRVALALLSVLLGASLASALLTVYGDITEKMSRELRSYGANILVRPKSEALELEIGGISYTPLLARTLLDERELPKIKTIFWKHNVTGIVPSLSTVVTVSGQPVVLTGTWFEKKFTVPQLAPKQFVTPAKSSSENRDFTTGVRGTLPWWQVEGGWVSEDDKEGAMVGKALARKLGLAQGDRFTLSYESQSLTLRTEGVVSTGGFEENQVFVNLSVAQQLLGVPYGVDRVLVSAMATPSNKIPAAIRGKEPGEMTPKEYELWYCTPLVESIAFQIEEVVNGARAAPIRQVSEAESSFLGRTELLVLLVSGAALAASALGVMATMTTMVMERRREIGLMKAIGAENSQIATIFLMEAGIIGLVGGVMGYALGLGLAQFVGREVFGMPFSFNAMAFPLTLALSTLVALAGSALPVRQGTHVEPIELLKGI